MAKVANRRAKKNKIKSGCVYVLDTIEKEVEALQDTPIGDIWGIGRQYAKSCIDQWALFDAHIAVYLVPRAEKAETGYQRASGVYAGQTLPLAVSDTGTKRDWKMRQEKRSPRYTTRWEEICLVY